MPVKLLRTSGRTTLRPEGARRLVFVGTSNWKYQHPRLDHKFDAAVQLVRVSMWNERIRETDRHGIGIGDCQVIWLARDDVGRN